MPERGAHHVEPKVDPLSRDPYYDLNVARYPSGVGYSFGPGGITPAVKILIITNVVLFVLNVIVGEAMTIGWD